MLQLDISIIIIIIFAALGFFTMGFFIGRSGRDKVIIHTPDGKYEIEERVRYSTDSMGGGLAKATAAYSNYPKDGLRAVDEPSGVVMRPTAKELKKMHEDEATKQAKEEVARAFNTEEAPNI